MWWWNFTCTFVADYKITVPMKITLKLLLTFLMPAAFCLNSKANDEIVSEMDTVTVNVKFADYFNETAADTLCCDAEGFHISFIKPVGANYVTYPPSYTDSNQCVRMYDGNAMYIVHSDSLHIVRVDLPPVIIGPSAEWLGGGICAGGGQMDPEEHYWAGDTKVFGYRFNRYSSYSVPHNYLYIKNVEITYLQPKNNDKKSVRMVLHDVRIRSVSLDMARLDFSLDVEDDDDVQDFTITANDADSGMEYGELTFDRYSFGGGEAPQRAALQADAGSNGYTIHGSTYLTGFAAGTRPLVNVSVQANYNDGTTSAGPTDGIQVSAPITTGITSQEISPQDVAPRYYDMMGREVVNPANGIYVRRCGSEIGKVVINSRH